MPGNATLHCKRIIDCQAVLLKALLLLGLRAYTVLLLQGRNQRPSFTFTSTRNMFIHEWKTPCVTSYDCSISGEDCSISGEETKQRFNYLYHVKYVCSESQETNGKSNNLMVTSVDVKLKSLCMLPTLSCQWSMVGGTVHYNLTKRCQYR